MRDVTAGIDSGKDSDGVSVDRLTLGKTAYVADPASDAFPHTFEGMVHEVDRIMHIYEESPQHSQN